jgi:hypothetical protein
MSKVSNPSFIERASLVQLKLREEYAIFTFVEKF